MDIDESRKTEGMDYTSKVVKTDFGKSAIDGYWLFGIPGCLPTLLMGALFFAAYCYYGNTLLLIPASSITAYGLMAIWLNVLLMQVDRKKGQKFSTTRISVFWIFMVSIIFAICLPFIISAIDRYDESVFLMMLIYLVIWLIISLVLFCFGMLRIRIAVITNKRLAFILGSVLLAILISVTAFIFLDDDLKKECIDCKDNLRNLNRALGYYAAKNNGAYPASLEELVEEGYLKMIPDNNPYRCNYSLDTSVYPPRAVCSEGHTY